MKLYKFGVAGAVSSLLPASVASAINLKLSHQWSEGDVRHQVAQLVADNVAAHYLVEAHSADGGAVDPVARFHMGNGARLENIHIGADNSARGRSGSLGRHGELPL